MWEHAPLSTKFRNVCADVVQSAVKDKNIEHIKVNVMAASEVLHVNFTRKGGFSLW